MLEPRSKKTTNVSLLYCITTRLGEASTMVDWTPEPMHHDPECRKQMSAMPMLVLGKRAKNKMLSSKNVERTLSHLRQ